MNKGVCVDANVGAVSGASLVVVALLVVSVVASVAGVVSVTSVVAGVVLVASVVAGVVTGVYDCRVL